MIVAWDETVGKAALSALLIGSSPAKAHTGNSIDIIRTDSTFLNTGHLPL
jgi:hypothetical protein